MTMKIFTTVFLLLWLLHSTACDANKTNQTIKADEQAAIKGMVEKYKDSINTADAKLGATLFSQSSEVSFIHPRGHEHGWTGIEKGIYKMFAESFTKRDLKSSNEKISVYGDTAWVEFYWIFDATLKDNSPIQTTGRETQIWKKEKTEWRLMHVHYSGIPVTTPRQGF